MAARSPITTAPLVGRSVPDRLGAGPMHEHHPSGFIHEDLQTGTITEQWVLPGNPWEAREGPGMQNLQIKDIHAWYGGHADKKYAYLIKRHFDHYAKSSDSDDRRTLATFVWQLRPCPHAFEEEEVGTLVSRLVWWSLDDPPQPMGSGEIGFAIMVPSRLLMRRYPAVELTGQQIRDIMGELGKTNGLPFAGESASYWLFQNARRKMLWGNALTLDGVYEITLFFLGDPERRHKHWAPILSRPGVPLKPERLEDRPDVHNKTTQYPESSVDFNDLVDISAVIANCFPEAPPG